MQKLKLNLQQMKNVEVLTRSQLKNVLGGVAPNTTSAYSNCSTTCSDGTTISSDCVGGCSTDDGKSTWCNDSTGTKSDVKNCPVA